MAGIIARIAAIMPEREIFVRAGGSVRFVRISTRIQFIVASAVIAVMALWLFGMGALIWRQSSVGQAEAKLAAQRSAVNSAAARASADRRSVDAIARELEERQNSLDALMQSHFGKAVDQSRVVGQQPKAGEPRTIGAAAPLSGTQRLAALQERQQQFTDTLTGAAKTRLAKVEGTIRKLGLNPSQLARGGQGGPFIPARAGALSADSGLRPLAGLLDRLNALETALNTLPSGRPTMAPMVTSSYGYRRDPFNGMAAFHAGIDFPGAYGQPILAASDGKVVFAGQRSGYGNCLEVDHGHGILTRYAHLSSFVARTGETVKRGQQVARMGSTGRSTGTHLHFEVRVNGAAVDPRPFLEARQDVLENTKQADIGSAQRTRNRG
jgi:murein DD-endopeptidase MepM/ murein hydrolase activator NlpD